MFVRDIVERPTSKPDSSAPQPPRAPVASKGGFPAVAHRSKGGSAFARARKDDAVRRAGGLVTGEGRTVESVPTVQPQGPTTGLSEAEEVRRSVDKDNTRRVVGMSDAEREQEAAELKERFGGGVVDLMRKRREMREGAGPSGAASTSTAASDPPTSTPTPTAPTPAKPAPMQYTTTADLNDAHKILASVDEENNAKISGMSSAEVDNEVRELEERFGASLMGKLKARAAERAKKEKKEEKGKQATVEDSEDKEAPAPKKGVRFEVEEPTPSEMKQKYFANVPSEDAKLQWMQGTAPPPTSSSISPDPNAPRYDLSGAPLTPEAAAALPTHLGLHHHGDQPDLAGYTILEIVHLCYSTVASQRITMMGVLGRIITRFAATTSKDNDEWVKDCREADVVGKGVDVACGVLGGHTRSIGVFVAAVDLLFTALGGPHWGWMNGDESQRTIPFRPEPSREGEPTGVAAVPFSELAPRLGEALALDPGSLPSTTLAQLLSILERAALAVPEGAEAIVSLLPPLLKAHVLRAPWPLDPSRPPSRVALRLLRDVVVSSRAAAEALLQQNVFQPLLKFAAVEVAPEPVSQALLLEVLQIFYALGRYGQQASIATAAREIWQTLGTWVTSQLAQPTSPETSAIVVAYFDLLRIWTVCAVDPHRTTPEHDLTWAQISGLQWVDEEVAAVQALLGKDKWAELAAVLSALSESVAGVEINGVKKGEAEKAAVLSALKNMDLVGSLPQGVDSMPPMEVRPAFNAALGEVFRLHNLLRSSGSLLNSPERERFIWWIMATTQSTTEDVYLRHAALEAARADSVLDTAKWATSAFDLMLSLNAGDEPLALSVVDDLLRADWTKLNEGYEPDHADKRLSATEIAAAITGIGHKDGLQILRPLLHHAILPDIEGVLGPTRPSYLYLKATATLRPSPTLKAGPGLPLPQDWAFSPLDELLSSGSSSAFALAPSDWDAGETQLTRATLAFAAIQAAAASRPPPSLVILNAMKVFMLEHGQQDAPNTEQDVFRDTTVHAGLKALLDTTVSASTALGPPPAGPSAPLEAASKRFLTPGVPFFQFYTDLLALYEGVSFGDAQFARVLLPPLAMGYDVDYRRLLWAEQPGALRSVRVRTADVPVETSLGAYFFPEEENKDVLLGIARALPVLQADTFLFELATHHLAALFWAGGETERTSVRVQIMVVVLSSAPEGAVRAIVQHRADEAEIARRVKVMGELTGPRGVQRLRSMGFE